MPSDPNEFPAANDSHSCMVYLLHHRVVVPPFTVLFTAIDFVLILVVAVHIVLNNVLARSPSDPGVPPSRSGKLIKPAPPQSREGSTVPSHSEQSSRV